MTPTKLTKTQIKGLLEARLGYAPHVAELTVVDLNLLRDDDLREALLAWAANEANQPEVGEGEHTTRTLCASGLTYPAALIMVDWLRTDPVTAHRALAARM